MKDQKSKLRDPHASHTQCQNTCVCEIPLVFSPFVFFILKFSQLCSFGVELSKVKKKHDFQAYLGNRETERLERVCV